MSLSEIDKIMRKLFDSSKQEVSTGSVHKSLQSKEIPSNEFRNWLFDHIEEDSREERFKEQRLICIFCHNQITDQNYYVIHHPDYPDDYSRSIYFHSKVNCEERMKNIKKVRETWLKTHSKEEIERENFKSELINSFLSHFG